MPTNSPELLNVNLEYQRTRLAQLKRSLKHDVVIFNRCSSAQNFTFVQDRMLEIQECKVTVADLIYLTKFGKSHPAPVTK